MALEADIYAALNGATAAGARVYQLQAEQGAALPRLTFARVSTAPINSLAGSSGLDQTRVQIDAWATTPEAAQALAAEVRALMAAQPFKGLLESAFADRETETEVFRYTQDFRCWERLA